VQGVLRLIAIGVAASLTACSAGDAGTVVYLNFSDGTEAMTLGADDASKNVSSTCAIERLPRWEGARVCGGRQRCADAVVASVRHLWSAYAVTFLTTRPPAGTTYAMVVIAPPTQACSYGHRGIAPLDCGAHHPRDVAVVSDCYKDPSTCASLIAHELGHTLGLVHSADARDVMFDGPSDPAQSFRDAESPTVDGDCALATQNAHRTLMDRLGPR
jgi:hypothetical protein